MITENDICINILVGHKNKTEMVEENLIDSNEPITRLSVKYVEYTIYIYGLKGTVNNFKWLNLLILAKLDNIIETKSHPCIISYDDTKELFVISFAKKTFLIDNFKKFIVKSFNDDNVDLDYIDIE